MISAFLWKSNRLFFRFLVKSCFIKLFFCVIFSISTSDTVEKRTKSECFFFSSCVDKEKKIPASLNDHLELARVKDSLLGQFPRRDRLLGFGQLADKVVEAVRVQLPALLFGKLFDLVLGLEVEPLGRFLHGNALVRALQTGADLVAHRLQQDVGEEIVRFRRGVALGREDLVVAALHQVLLQGQRMPDVLVLLDDVRRQQLQLGVELGHAVLGQQEEQVQPEQLVLVLGFADFVPKSKNR